MEELDIKKINRLKMTYPRGSIYYKALTNLLNELERLQKDNFELDRKYHEELGNNSIIIESLEAENELAKETINNHCAEMDKINNILADLQRKNEQLNKGVNSLMNSRKKWKDRYYTLKIENQNITRKLLAKMNKLRNDSISKSIIEDKIEELEKYIYKGVNAPQDFLQYRIKAKIQILKEILGEE